MLEKPINLLSPAPVKVSEPPVMSMPPLEASKSVSTRFEDPTAVRSAEDPHATVLRVAVPDAEREMVLLPVTSREAPDDVNEPPMMDIVPPEIVPPPVDVRDPETPKFADMVSEFTFTIADEAMDAVLETEKAWRFVVQPDVLVKPRVPPVLETSP
jgi:hypothetical protein